jgi:hypothetical protein
MIDSRSNAVHVHPQAFEALPHVGMGPTFIIGGMDAACVCIAELGLDVLEGKLKTENLIYKRNTHSMRSIY